MLVTRGLPTTAPGAVALTIGNFDGVHRGHQAMLARLGEAAEDLALPPAVMTFEPLPREYFSPGQAPPRLSSLSSKLDVFRRCGVARTFVLRFDERLASLSPSAFVDLLVERIGVRWLLVGDDFRFGQQRAGNLAFLREHARTFSVEAMQTVIVDGERVSSTAVRQALAAADLERAARLLGRRYVIRGRVAHGRKLGRTLGFPTANLPLKQRPALSGIFAVRVHGLPGGSRDGVASLGVRPTVTSKGGPLLEVYILDFDGNLYGRRIAVEFLHKLRDEARFPDLATLTRQIEADVREAQRYFEAAGAPA